MMYDIFTAADTLKHKVDNMARLKNATTGNGTRSANLVPLPTVCYALINMQHATA